MKMNKLPITYYDVLQISHHAGESDIHRAYRRLARKWHPDMHPLNRHHAEKRMKLLNEAYGCLKTKTSRKAYDMKICTIAGRKRRRPVAVNDNRGALHTSDSWHRTFINNMSEIFWPFHSEDRREKSITGLNNKENRF